MHYDSCFIVEFVRHVPSVKLMKSIGQIGYLLESWFVTCLESLFVACY